MNSSTLVTTPVTTLYLDFLSYKKATKGLTASGEAWFRWTLFFFLERLQVPIGDVSRDTIVEFLGQYAHMPWRRHGFYRALRSPYRGLFITYQVPNPFIDQFGNPTIEPPKVPQKPLTTITPEQVGILIDAAKGSRNKALVSLLANSGGRRGEIAAIRVQDLDLERHRIRVWGKGGKEGLLIFGPTTYELLSKYLEECSPTGSLFGLTSYSVQTMLRRLGDKVGFKCPAHAFRRGFATELRKKGLSELDIAELGRWSSTAMVKRYSRAYTFEDAASRYKAIV